MTKSDHAKLETIRAKMEKLMHSPTVDTQIFATLNSALVLLQNVGTEQQS